LTGISILILATASGYITSSEGPGKILAEIHSDALTQALTQALT
jgi:hypothetical protein